MKRFDVIVVGAGTAGCLAAKTVAGQPILSIIACAARGELIHKGVYNAKEPRWIPFVKLKRFVLNELEKIYSHHLSALKYCVSKRRRNSFN